MKLKLVKCFTEIFCRRIKLHHLNSFPKLPSSLISQLGTAGCSKAYSIFKNSNICYVEMIKKQLFVLGEMCW